MVTASQAELSLNRDRERASIRRRNLQNDDSNMVKLGQELVDGKLSVVTGREGDRCRTVVIIQLASASMRLRLFAKANQIRG